MRLINTSLPTLLLICINLALAPAAQCGAPDAPALNRHGAPAAMQDLDSAGNQRYNPLFDAGSWQGYLLPATQQDAGSIGGPLIVAEEYSLFLARALERISLRERVSGHQYAVRQASWSSAARPGVLSQQLTWPGLQLDIDLHFADAHSAIVRYRLRNTSKASLALDLQWQGQLLDQWSAAPPISMAQRFPAWKPALSAQPRGLRITLPRVRDAAALMTSGQSRYQILRSVATDTRIDGQGYRATAALAPLRAGASTAIVALHSYSVDGTLADPAPYLNAGAAERAIAASEARWQARLDQLARAPGSTAPSALAVKALETLIGNWRAPAGAFEHDVIVPSTTNRWFNGAWAWDSWKHAYALAPLDPALAADSVRAMFDHQITAQDPVRPQDAGMIIDAIFYNRDGARGGDGTNWNERNSKPPLAAWAVWAIYEARHDKAWLREMRPKLEAYHHWWYRNRDHEHNGLVEYGAVLHPLHNDAQGNIRFRVKLDQPGAIAGCTPDSDGFLACVGLPAYEQVLAEANYSALQVPVQEAAGWESGMDNAARFGFIEPDALRRYAQTAHQGDLRAARRDWRVRVLPNLNADKALVGYSIDQESVDLNAFLYKEKMILADIAFALGDDAAGRSWRRDAAGLQRKINDCFFDAKSGFYYDRQIGGAGAASDASGCGGHLLTERGRGSEGWSPLWAGAADIDKARAVIATMLNPTEFNTPLPLPTAALSNPAYAPQAYWRGRVWVDQLYFAARALQNYGRGIDAQKMVARFLAHAQGLDGAEPIHENYNPMSGAMLGASNFSWSAANLLMLQREIGDGAGAPAR